MSSFEASCTGKARYLSKHSAMLALGQQKRRRRKFKRVSSEGSHAYRCGVCGKFHLGG